MSDNTNGLYITRLLFVPISSQLSPIDNPRQIPIGDNDSDIIDFNNAAAGGGGGGGGGDGGGGGEAVIETRFILLIASALAFVITVISFALIFLMASFFFRGSPDFCRLLSCCFGQHHRSSGKKHAAKERQKRHYTLVAVRANFGKIGQQMMHLNGLVVKNSPMTNDTEQNGFDDKLRHTKSAPLLRPTPSIRIEE